MKKFFKIKCFLLVFIIILASCNLSTSQINDEDIILPKLTEQEKNDIDSKDFIFYDGELFINLLNNFYKIEGDRFALIYKDFYALKEINGTIYGIKKGGNKYYSDSVQVIPDESLYNDSFAKIKPDGSEYEELVKLNGGYSDYYYNESENKFYINYFNFNTPIYLLEYDLKTKEYSKKENVKIEGFELKHYENHIYYIVSNDEYDYNLYKIDYDGKIQLLCENLILNHQLENSEYIIKNDMIYYISLYSEDETFYNYSLNKMNINGTGKEIVAKLRSCTQLQSYGDWVYIWGYDLELFQLDYFVKKINLITEQEEIMDVPTDDISYSSFAYGYYYYQKYIKKSSPHGETDFKKLYFYDIENKIENVIKFKNEIYEEIFYDGYIYITLKIPDEPVVKNKVINKYRYEVYKVKVGSNNIVKMNFVE